MALDYSQFVGKSDQEIADLISQMNTDEVAMLDADMSGAYERYRNKPAAYAEEVLKVELTPDQKKILEHLLIPPYRVMVPAGVSVGKTFTGAVAMSWWWDTRKPGVTINYAPTVRDIEDTTWAQIRILRQRAGLSMPFIGPKAPRMQDAPDHYAAGYTANAEESLRGRHYPNMLFLLEEASGLDAQVWHGVDNMFDPSESHATLAILNPSDPTSHAYIEDMRDEKDGRQRWHRIRLSMVNHPNVRRQWEGKPKAIRGAASLEMLTDMIYNDCEPVDHGDERATDFAWPPLDWPEHPGQPRRWYRPGPKFQSMALGMWADAGDGVWTPSLWQACVDKDGMAAKLTFPTDSLPVIGCDMAMGKGDDFHAIASQWGGIALSHSTSNTMNPEVIADKLKLAAVEMAELATKERDKRHGRGLPPVDPKRIRIHIDDDASGGTVAAFLRAEGWLIIPIGAGTVASDERRYPNKRSQLWFSTAEKARAGLVFFGRLRRDDLNRIRQQCMAPSWRLDPAGRRKVESKDATKEKIGRSPDDADAVNLAYYSGDAYQAPRVYTEESGGPRTPEEAERGQVPGGGGRRGTGGTPFQKRGLTGTHWRRRGR